MPVKIKIALQVPHSDPTRSNRYFSLRLKQELTKESGIYKRTEATFVVSDTGGDFQLFCQILYKGGVINRMLHWTFGTGRLVILGNCLDDNKDMLECLWLIYALEEKAQKKGGHVHFILGNNEIRNINGDWRFRHPRYALREVKNASTALYDGSNELWRWLKTKNLVERIGHILFVHGSVSVKLLSTVQSIDEINGIARSYIADPNLIFDAPAIGDNLNEVLNDNGHNIEVGEEQIDRIIKKFSVRVIVTGCQKRRKIEVLCQGKVINVHTDHVDGQSEALFIKRQRFLRVSNIC